MRSHVGFPIRKVVERAQQIKWLKGFFLHHEFGFYDKMADNAKVQIEMTDLCEKPNV